MKVFLANLKGNSFYFMCIFTGAIAVVIFTKSNPPIFYMSGLLVSWVLVSLLGVNIEESQALARSKSAANKEM